MNPKLSKINIALGGGGVRGIAYIGVFAEAYDRGYKWGNIAGVSAGALAGSFLSAGMSPYEMWKNLNEFDFEEVQFSKIPKKVPVIERYLEFVHRTRTTGEESIKNFFSRKYNFDDFVNEDESDQDQYLERSNFFKNIATFAKEGSLFDGDYLEEWISICLRKKGIRTFGDLRGGTVDKQNPKGYKLRVTGVDCTRAKLVVLPDDLEFYGINPDEFEVAKAIRISTCNPFAFKPVEIKKTEGKKTKTYYLIDGGALDSFPHWAINAETAKAVGFVLKDGNKKPGFFSLNTALDILKSIISAIHDPGLPKDKEIKIKYIGEILISPKISMLDFNLSNDDKVHMFNAGKNEAYKVFNKMERDLMRYRRGFFYPFSFFRY
ncbi:MAG TPA: patatin [Clostridiaceae bacterium]|nr:patatin [Clostridiaceae bacterium]